MSILMAGGFLGSVKLRTWDMRTCDWMNGLREGRGSFGLLVTGVTVVIRSACGVQALVSTEGGGQRRTGATFTNKGEGVGLEFNQKLLQLVLSTLIRNSWCNLELKI